MLHSTTYSLEKKASMVCTSGKKEGPRVFSGRATREIRAQLGETMREDVERWDRVGYGWRDGSGEM